MTAVGIGGQTPGVRERLWEAAQWRHNREQMAGHSGSGFTVCRVTACREAAAAWNESKPGAPESERAVSPKPPLHWRSDGWNDWVGGKRASDIRQRWEQAGAAEKQEGHVPSSLTSVWEGTDNGFLRRAVPFYLRERYSPVGTRVLDSTYGLGVFWQDGIPAEWRLIGMDINSTKPAGVVADNGALPFGDAAFDVVIFDPPHIVHPWSDWDEAGRYSIAKGRGSIAYLFPSFLIEAHRCLAPGGILIAKLADQVHSGRSWFQMGEYVNMLPFAGLTPCDIVVKVRGRARPQPTGRGVRHAARRHSYYVVARRGRC